MASGTLDRKSYELRPMSRAPGESFLSASYALDCIAEGHVSFHVEQPSHLPADLPRFEVVIVFHVENICGALQGILRKIMCTVDSKIQIASSLGGPVNLGGYSPLTLLLSAWRKPSRQILLHNHFRRFHAALPQSATFWRSNERRQY